MDVPIQTKKLCTIQRVRVEENKRAAKSVESFHCKTSFVLRKERRERKRASLSLSLSLSLSEMAEEEKRRGEDTHTTGNGFRKLGKRTDDDDDDDAERKIGTDVARVRERRRRTGKGGIPTTNT